MFEHDFKVKTQLKSSKFYRVSWPHIGSEVRCLLHVVFVVAHVGQHGEPEWESMLQKKHSHRLDLVATNWDSHTLSLQNDVL